MFFFMFFYSKIRKQYRKFWYICSQLATPSNMSPTAIIKNKCLAYAQKQEHYLLLNSNQIKAAMNLNCYEFIFMCGKLDSIETNDHNALEQLASFTNKHKGKWMGLMLSYDLKNEIEKLASKNKDEIGLPLAKAFVPEFILSIDKNEKIECNDAAFLKAIETESELKTRELPHVDFKARVEKAQYIEQIETIKKHIVNGDVYELNYCIEFYKEACPMIEPVTVYEKLNTASPTPFSALYSSPEHAIICASPERFILKKGTRIYSQPIKGTIQRMVNKDEDEQMKQRLLNSEKERAENLMIVDLVRNDLAKSSKTGSVKVEELFGIYSFKNLHQMISTVCAELMELNNIACIQNAFPMGSMTGAPKIKAMEIIDELEQTKRGMYSGSIGYLNPNGDFDLNVVIRSLQYNKQKHYLNFEVGSAITIDSDAESEFQECLLKGNSMIQIFEEPN